MGITLGFAGTVGNTPLIRLRAVSEETGCEILAKAEFMNPGGSVKDRAARAIVLDAEARHLAQRLGERSFSRPPHHRWQDMAGHQRQYAAGVAGRSVVRGERHLRRNPGQEERMDCDWRLDDCEDTRHRGRGQHVERV